MKKLFLSGIPVIFLFVFAILISQGHAASQSEKTIPLDPSIFPDVIAVDNFHNKAYIAAHTTVANVPMPVTILDTLHDVVLGVIPSATLHALAVNGTTHRLYTGSATSNGVTVYDTDTNTPVSTVTTDGGSPLALAVNESTNRIYAVSNAATNGIMTIIDGTMNTVIPNAIKIGSNPRAIAINPLNNKIYIIAADNNPGLTIIDGATNTLISSLPVSSSLTDIAVDSILNKIYISADGGNTLYVVDGQTNTMSTPIRLSEQVPCAHTLSVNPVTHTLYAACFNGMTVIDTQTDTLLQEFPLTGELPITRAISSQYFSMDSVTNKLFVPLEETHQIAVISLTNPPKFEAVTSVKGVEGSSISLPVSFTDVAATSVTATVDYGDASTQDHISPFTSGLPLHHIYQKSGIFSIHITLADALGQTASASTSAEITNISPTVGAIIPAESVINQGKEIMVHAAFTDPGSEDSFSARWYWGDGMTSQGILSTSESGGTVTGTHLYAQPGVYTVSVTVTDHDGAATTNTLQYVAVNAGNFPNAAGAGSISFAPKSFAENVPMNGKINFGFSVFQGHIQNTWEGKAVIHFQNVNADFESTGIDSYTATGTKVVLTGRGKVHRSGEYAFALTAENSNQNSVPLMRIKIWELHTGKIFFDSQMNEADSIDPTSLVQDGLVHMEL